MASIEQLAETALRGDALDLRALVQDYLRENRDLFRASPPQSDDPTILAVAASLVELLAQHHRHQPPAWTRLIASAPRPVYLVKAAHTMRRLRQLCEDESPEPLRRRNLFAPPTYLQFA